MRIAGYIDHSTYKITVFELDNRYALKIENEFYEQTYKLRKGPRLSSLADIQQLVDGRFLDGVGQVFQAMHRNRVAAIGRLLPQGPEEKFPEII